MAIRILLLPFRLKRLERYLDDCIVQCAVFIPSETPEATVERVKEYIYTSGDPCISIVSAQDSSFSLVQCALPMAGTDGG